MLFGEAARLGALAHRGERAGGLDTPGREGGVAGFEPDPARGCGSSVRLRVGGAVLGEPQPRPALQQQGCAEGSGRRFAELAGGGECGVGGVELVGLGEGVHQWVQRPQQSGRRAAVGQLEVERETGVGLSLPDAAGAHERHGPDEAAVSERDQPAARAREIDERGAARGHGVDVVVGGEHDGGRGGQERVGLAVERAVGEERLEQRVDVGGRSPVERGLHGGVDAPEPESAGLQALGLQPCPALASGVLVMPGVADEFGFEALAIIGRRSGAVLESSAAEVERMVEAAGEAECAGAAQGDLGALRRRRGELDGVVEHGGRVGLDVSGEREPELEPDARGGIRVERRLGDGAAEEARGAFRCAAGGCAGGGRAQSGDGGRVRLGLGVQQMERDSLGVGALVGQHARRVGVPQRPLAGSQVRIEGAGDQRMRERDRPVAMHEPRGAQPVGRAGGAPRIQARQPGGVAQRRARAEDRQRARERARSGREALELAFDAEGDLVRPERAESRGGGRVWRDVLGHQVVEQRAEEERVAGGDRVAGVREDVVGGGQPGGDERLGGVATERSRPDRRLGGCRE